MGSQDYKFLNPGSRDWEFNLGIAITNTDRHIDSSWDRDRDKEIDRPIISLHSNGNDVVQLKPRDTTQT